MSLLEQEIAEQPAVAQRLLDATWPRLAELGEVLRRDGAEEVLLVARGSSDNAVRYAGYLWGLRLGMPTTLALPSLASVYGRSLDLHRHAVVAVSQSGSSPDVVGIVTQAAEAARPTLAVTNAADSTLAAAAETVLPLGGGPERSVAATKTYTSSLLAMALLGVALRKPTGERDAIVAADRPDLDAVPGALEAAVHGIRGVPAAVDLLAGHDRAVCVGRGLNLATAHETALKLTELSGMLVAPYSPADLLHGPVAAVGPDVPAVLIAPDEPGSDSVLGVIEELRRRGAPVVVVAPESRRLPEDVLHVALPEEAAVAGWLTPLPTVIAGQLLGVQLATARGVDVDRPGGLNKVTRTY